MVIAQRFRQFLGGAMRRTIRIATFIAISARIAAPAFSDTLVLKSGEKISGFFEGGSSRTVKFRAVDGPIKDYDILSVQEIQFGEAKSATPATTAAPAAT